MLKTARLISDGCVLQQHTKVRIWGTDEPESEVCVTIQSQNAITYANEKGDWEVFLSDLAPGGPFSMKVEDKEKNEIIFSEIYVGEVWVCSGQSNMELMMERVLDRYPEELSAGRNSLIRHFKVEEKYEFQKACKDYEAGEWKECTPDNLSEVSAVSYFYGKYMYEALGVPIGLINASKGGSRIEAWMSTEALTDYPQLLAQAQEYKEEGAVQKFTKEQEKRMADWLADIKDKEPLDDDWREISIPGYLQEAGAEDFCGSILLRRTFYVPAELAGDPAELWLGTLVDSDRTYINATFVGETGYEYPPRKYKVPDGLLKEGKNDITIRLVCNNGKGRATPGKEYCLLFERERIDLSGKWQYQILCKSKAAPEMDFICRKAAGLYNAMLSPSQNYTIRGVFWYQGESNDKRPHDYEDLLKQLILSWRKEWGKEELPFIIAQLPNFSIDLEKTESGWPKIRKAQEHAAKLPGTALTVNLELGEENDLHPLNKKEVAYRAALAARGMVYGEEICFSGPVLKKWSVEEDYVKVIFDTKDGDSIRTIDKKEPEEFCLAGADGIFYSAEAVIKGKEVLLRSSQVLAPAAIRYAYSNAPKNGLLCNESGLLAAPFETDCCCRLFNDDWEFMKQPLSATLEDIDEAQEAFQPVSLPHDWLIEQGKALYEDGSGWYRKRFFWYKKADQSLFLRFEGIYMDSTIYINGREIIQWKYGYSTFEVDMTPYLKAGENEILVRTAFQAPNSRWYSGAGIYRDVWLKQCHTKARLVSDGSYITVCEKENGLWELNVSTEIKTRTEKGRTSGTTFENEEELLIYYQLLDMQQKKTVISKRIDVKNAEKQAEDVSLLSWKTMIENPMLWDVKNPYRYQVAVSLTCDGEIWQQETYTIGFRSIQFSPEEGFLLNHKKIKLNGVCEHHDLGCLGASYASAAMRRKLCILQEMGVNALRLTHNMHAPDVMELADEMGFLVVSEAFDMWERSKNPYDYARFFPKWYKKDVASWVRRDRNHPSLIMWSIGNEIYDTHIDENGRKLTKLLRAEVMKHDPDTHAGITIGSNYMPWENAQKCADIVKIAGYNYGEKYYETHHREHPDWIIYGSETAAVVQSRGIYHFPVTQSVLSDMDSQCSALGNSTTSWGAKSPESCIIAERDCHFSCGQFLWTGFDYIGEPTPYHTRNSYFGQIDTAGFPKDSYYIFQAEWTDYKEKPMIHIFPYWDFNEGQLIDVRVCSNAPEIELFVNDESQGRYRIDHKGGNQLAGHWQIPYTKGEITACAYDEYGKELIRETRKSFTEAYKIVLKLDRTVIAGDRRDMAFVEITVADCQDNPVENAVNRMKVQVSGSGRLAGLDNGDSTDCDEYKTNSRKLFSGKLLAVIVADGQEGEIKIRVESPGLIGAAAKLHVGEPFIRDGIGKNAYGISDDRKNAENECSMEIPVRAIRLTSPDGTVLSPEQSTTTVKACICPQDAPDREVSWCIVNDAGIPSSLAEIEMNGTEAKVTAKSDGRFRLRCMSKSGTEHIRIISELNFSVEGFGRAWLNPYKLIAGGLYDYSRGDVSNGNEFGVATARDTETQVGFHGIDFGEFGSDRITLPVFALTDEKYPITIWEGMPGEAGSEIVGEFVYQKPSVWNVYQEDTYCLKRRLKGVTSICFVLHQKIHLKGFSFEYLEKAYEKLNVTECSKVYGDSFVKTEDSIDQIGNNVTIVFEQMDFGNAGAEKLEICGYTPLEKNAIQIRVNSETGESVQLVEFWHNDQVSKQCFCVNEIKGAGSVSFVFLPGSQFDFKWFRFLGKSDG